MKCIAITLPRYSEREASAIELMLRSGTIDRVHIRKPEACEADIRRLIEEIPAGLRSRLSLHDCHCLAAEYGCGVHLNVRNPYLPPGFDGTVSRSCHNLDEALLPADYRFLSPIFDSISKAGYSSAFSLDSLRGNIDRSYVALGGVKPDKLPLLWDTGFGGAAFLGYVWSGDLRENLRTIENFKSCCNS